MHSREFIARGIARAFVAGTIKPAGLADRAAGLFARRWRWVSSLARRVATRFGSTGRPKLEDVTRFLRKTRIMRRSVRQRLAGIVVNDRPNVARDEYDRLKAILHNSLRLGPESQNRAGVADFRAHLTGRVAFLEMITPHRGRRLREMLQRIDW